MREKSTEQIEFELRTKRIVLPDKRILAEMEVARRREESELTQAKNDLKECQKRLRGHKIALIFAGIGAAAGVAMALAAWWPSDP